MDSFEKDEERIRRLLQTCDVSSDEADDDDSGEEEDNLKARLDSTDTEQEMNDIDSEDELDTDDLESYIGKDREKVWKKNKPRVNVRTCAHKIITQQTGVKDFAKHAKTPGPTKTRDFS